MDINTDDFSKPHRDPRVEKRRDWSHVWNAIRGRYGSRHSEVAIGRAPKLKSDREYHDEVRRANRRERRTWRRICARWRGWRRAVRA